MKKLLLLVFVAFSFVSYAQLDTVPRLSMGLRVGLDVSNMRYTDEMYKCYKHSLTLGPDVGFYMRTRIKNHWSFRSDLTIAHKGVGMSWCDVDYKFSSYYLDLRLPIQYNFFKKGSRFSPYLYLGPTVSCAMMGNIHYSSIWTPATDYDLTRGSVRQIDVGGIVGLGIDWTFTHHYQAYIVSLEAMYGMGFLNNFSASEVEGHAGALNPEHSAYQNRGKRFHEGFGVAVCFHIPTFMSTVPEIDSLDLAWNGESDAEKKKAIEDCKLDSDMLGSGAYLYFDSTRKYIDYEYKECYTIDEIFDLVNENISVENLRMCLFDVKFEFDSYDLSRTTEIKLKKIVKLLNLYPEMTIAVYGHTDSKGSDEYNDRLSNNRALSVAAYLYTKGIPFSRVSYQGFGEKRPIDTNNTAKGRYHNRRVEIEIIHMGPRAAK